MHKVYLLLRNNKQSGPYSLEELVQQGLKPFDLIWIEGKSCGWSYPSEVDSLQPYITPEGTAKKAERTGTTAAAAATPLRQQQPVYSPSPVTAPAERPRLQNASPIATASKKVYVNMPKNFMHTAAVVEETLASDTMPQDALERKAEELRRKVQAYAAEKKDVQPLSREAIKALQQQVAKAQSTRWQDDAQQDDTSWIYAQKAKKKTKLSKRKIAIGALILLLSATTTYLLIDKLKTLRKASVENSVVQSDELVKTSSMMQAETQPATENSAGKNIIQFSTTALNQDAGKTTGVNKIGKAEKNIAGNNPLSLANAQQKPVLESSNNDVTNTTNTAKKSNDLVKEKAPASNREVAENNYSQPDENNMYNTSANKASFLDITTNKPAGGTKGVQGLKVTLSNTGEEVIGRARVAVYYYNEQNKLLEKKLLYFRNIEPNKPITVPAPDQRLADHVDYHLVSVK